MGPDKAERFLARLRQSNPDALSIYTRGQCYQLFLVLREVFNAEAWWDPVASHVYSRIGEAFYDIRGKHIRCNADGEFVVISCKASRDKARIKLLVAGDCPHSPWRWSSGRST